MRASTMHIRLCNDHGKPHGIDSEYHLDDDDIAHVSSVAASTRPACANAMAVDNQPCDTFNVDCSASARDKRPFSKNSFELNLILETF